MQSIYRQCILVYLHGSFCPVNIHLVSELSLVSVAALWEHRLSNLNHVSRQPEVQQCHCFSCYVPPAWNGSSSCTAAFGCRNREHRELSHPTVWYIERGGEKDWGIPRTAERAEEEGTGKSCLTSSLRAHKWRGEHSPLCYATLHNTGRMPSPHFVEV